jgi:uncharacterized membrane protein YeaQ/YmgE (transglycosylase-associated protein family)
MGFVNPILGSGGALVRPAIKSPNYVPGSSGWMVGRDGSSEFSSGTFRGAITATSGTFTGTINAGGTFTGTNYILNSAGLFLYSGTPGLGNLTGSIASAAGADAFLNNYLAGSTTYDRVNKLYTNCANGSVEVGPLVTGVGPMPSRAGGMTAQFPAGFPATGILAGPTDATHDTGPQVDIIAGSFGAALGSAAAPAVKMVGDPGQTTAVTLGVGGAVVALDPASGALQNPYTWQTPTYNTGWTGGSTASASYQPLMYRITAENELWLFGAAHATAAAPSATVFTLPTAYQPAPTGGVGSASIFAAGALVQTAVTTDVLKIVGRVNVMSSGVVVLGGFTIASGDNFYFNHRVPLGNIP